MDSLSLSLGLGNEHIFGGGGAHLVYPITADVNDGLQVVDLGVFPTAPKTGDVGSIEAIGWWHLAGIAIERGAIIDDATFSIRATGSTSGTGTITLRAQKTASATVPGNANLPSVMALTTAGVTVPFGVGDKSLDVTAIIQELVNQPGWTSGSNINLIAIDDAYVLDNGSNITFAGYPAVGFGSLLIDQHQFTLNNLVQFDGANDFLRRGANIFTADPKSMVIYADLTTPEKVDTTTFICAATALLMSLNVGANGSLNLLHSSATIDATNFVPAGTFQPSTRYRLAICIQCDTVNEAVDGIGKIWLSAAGGAWTLVANIPPTSISDSTTMGLTGATNFTLFSNPTLNSMCWGRVSDVTKVDGALVGFIGIWASTSRMGAVITDPSIFFSGGKDANLMADLALGSLLPAPLVAFGGSQVAADWNAGTNMGTAGDFVMQGMV